MLGGGGRRKAEMAKKACLILGLSPRKAAKNMIVRVGPLSTRQSTRSLMAQ